jgi:hypothetical protein
MRTLDVMDIGSKTHGRIRLFELAPDGQSRLVLARANVVVYTAADLLAKLAAGMTGAAPQHIGFLYGESATPPSLTDPAALPLATRRVHPWTQIQSDVAANTANVIICPLVMPASVALDADSDASYYTANAVTFTSHTGAFTEYAFSTSSGTYAGTLDSLANVYFYHAILLNRVQVGETITYIPFARVALETAPFTAKAANRELAIYWDVVFK